MSIEGLDNVGNDEELDEELDFNDDEELDEEEEGEYYEGARVIVIDGDDYEVVDVYNHGFLPEITCVYPRNTRFVLAKDDEHARQAAYSYWENLLNEDRREFIALFGEERIIEEWTRGSTVEDFLDDLSGEYENLFGSYDGYAIDIDIDEQKQPYFDNLCNDLGFVPTMAFRS